YMKSESFDSKFYELKARSFTEDLLRYGVGKCYYFSLYNIGKKIWRGLSVGGGAVRKHALLCTKATSTSDNPELVLYLDAVRGRQKRYENLNFPINLIFEGNQTLQYYFVLASRDGLAASSAVASRGGVSRLAIAPSPNDVPPGSYIWDSVPPELELETATMVVVYEHGSASAHFYLFDKSEKSEPFHSEFYQLKARSFTEDLFDYHVGKCYYFSLHNMANKIWRNSLVGGGAVRKHALLCTKDTSTRSHPQLTLYLDAVRGVGKKYDQLNMPVDLNFTGNQNTTGASAPPRGPHESDDGSPTKAVVTFPSRCKSMKDGNYLNLSAILNLETRHDDGRQRAILTSNDGNERFSTFENVLVVPAEDYLTTGCCELENTGIFICPTGADDLLLRAPGMELELVYGDIDALEA
ncbi:hypothetical protein FOZ63_008571, partial [Perkinsus olseni]